MLIPVLWRAQPPLVPSGHYTRRASKQHKAEPTVSENTDQPTISKPKHKTPILKHPEINWNDPASRDLLENVYIEKFPDEPRKLQIDTAWSLLRKQDTFLMATTGYGKTRIAELIYYMYDPESGPIILILNPLDALGDNQVSFALTLILKGYANC